MSATKVWYLDTSAIIKLIVQESESKALRKFLDGGVVTSRFSRIELARYIRLMSERDQENAQELLRRFYTLSLEDSILSQAEMLTLNTPLKAPDAIHVASALSVQRTTEGLVTYDKQMVAEAKKLGLRVESPE